MSYDRMCIDNSRQRHVNGENILTRSEPCGTPEGKDVGAEQYLDTQSYCYRRSSSYDNNYYYKVYADKIIYHSVVLQTY